MSANWCKTRIAEILILGAILVIAGCEDNGIFPSKPAPVSHTIAPIADVPAAHTAPLPLPPNLKPDAPDFVKEYFENRSDQMGGKVDGKDGNYAADITNFEWDGEGYKIWTPVSPGMAKGTVVQVIDDQDFLMSYGPLPGEMAWVSGMSTTQMVDGAPVNGCFYVAGRKQYQSALGMRTVYWFRSFNPDDYLEKSK